MLELFLVVNIQLNFFLNIASFASLSTSLLMEYKVDINLSTVKVLEF